MNVPLPDESGPYRMRRGPYQAMAKRCGPYPAMAAVYITRNDSMEGYQRCRRHPCIINNLIVTSDVTNDDDVTSDGTNLAGVSNDDDVTLGGH